MATKLEQGGTDFSNQRPAYPIHPPAIIQHRAFRLQPDDHPNRSISQSAMNSPRGGGVRDHTEEKFVSQLNLHVNSVRHLLDLEDESSTKIVSFREEETDKTQSLRRSVVIDSSPLPKKDGKRPFRLRIRFDLYNEFFSITYIFDHIDVSINNILSKQVRNIYENPGHTANESADWLLDEVLGNSLLSRIKKKPDGKQKSIDQLYAELSHSVGGELFIDFRGLVLCPDVGTKMLAPCLGDIDASRPVGSRGDGTTCLRPPSISNCLTDFASKHDPLIRHIASSMEMVAESEGIDIVGAESVVCGMLDGHAIYAAELAKWGEARKLQPIRHLLVYGGTSSSQIGRLVRRLHVIGELRHVALLDYDLGAGANDLMNASSELHRLGSELDGFLGKTDENRNSVNLEKLQEKIKEFSEISRIGQSNLMYRIEQSRYYFDEFFRMLDDFNIVRYGNWQAYDSFVKRYIYQLYRRIDSIGKRHENLRRRLNSAMQLRQISLQTQLLEKGEAFATAFLIYYFGSAVLKILETLHPDKICDINWCFDLKMLVTILWLFGIGLGLLNIFRSFKRWK